MARGREQVGGRRARAGRVVITALGLAAIDLAARRVTGLDLMDVIRAE